jgi:hypothetical protein
MNQYRAPWWLPGGHAQTIIPARVLPAPTVIYRRERWDAPDGDFIDVDFVTPEPSNPNASLMVLFHGLEGDSRSHYARILMQGCRRRSWLGMVVHFRGCSGEPNRMPRAYHSGDSEEIDWILRRLALRWPRAQRFAVGISLGGNALAKWAGERGEQASGIVSACATVSAPFDLVAGGRSLDRGANVIYSRLFLQTMRKKAMSKAQQFPGLFDARKVVQSRSMYAFDDAFTAPLHGFRGVLDYWSRASAKPLLAAIAIPTLALNARNDPIVPADSLPDHGQVSRHVRQDVPSEGGHVGFFAQGRHADRWYLRERIFQFFQKGS